MLTFEDIILGKKYRDKATNFAGIALSKSCVYNYPEPVVRLQGSLVFTPTLSINTIPVYDIWLSSLEEVEDQDSFAQGCANLQVKKKTKTF